MRCSRTSLAHFSPDVIAGTDRAVRGRFWYARGDGGVVATTVTDQRGALPSLAFGTVRRTDIATPPDALSRQASPAVAEMQRAPVSLPDQP